MRETPLGVESDRIPLSRQEIRQRERTEAFVSPNYGDGGWHATPGTEESTTEWEPLKDRILVEILPEINPYKHIVMPESGSFGQPSRRAIVLKAGSGIRRLLNGERRSCCCVKPGDEVVIGLHDDWASQDGRYALCQEADVRAIITRGENNGAHERSRKKESSKVIARRAREKRNRVVPAGHAEASR